MSRAVALANPNGPASQFELPVRTESTTALQADPRHAGHVFCQRAPAVAHFQRPYLEPIFIVGQYKCGTTWLLTVLSAHPLAVGVDEIDIIHAACKVNGSAVHLTPLEERLRLFFVNNAWASSYRESHWKNFLAELEKNEPIPTAPWNTSRPQKIVHLPPQITATLYNRIKAAECAEEAMDAFLEAVCTEARGASRVVLKACDQVRAMGVLKHWQPKARKIFITRDGRDAAISGFHYEKWSKEQNDPFGKKGNDYWTLLQQWTDRAKLAADWARQGELRIVRYEDLSRDFNRTLKSLLVWLGLEHSDATIEAINAKTSFEATTGRPRGVEAKDFRRKGSIREWVDFLSAEDKARAWEIAGRQLEAFGYSHDGELAPLPDFQS
jgi:hypothetical protein